MGICLCENRKCFSPVDDPVDEYFLLSAGALETGSILSRHVGFHHQSHQIPLRWLLETREARRTKDLDKDRFKAGYVKRVKELQSAGLEIAQLSKKLDIARQAVRKNMKDDLLPKRASKECHPKAVCDASTSRRSFGKQRSNGWKRRDAAADTSSSTLKVVG